jgi:hypothetical protein
MNNPNFFVPPSMFTGYSYPSPFPSYPPFNLPHTSIPTTQPTEDTRHKDSPMALLPIWTPHYYPPFASAPSDLPWAVIDTPQHVIHYVGHTEGCFPCFIYANHMDTNAQINPIEPSLILNLINSISPPSNDSLFTRLGLPNPNQPLSHCQSPSQVRNDPSVRCRNCDELAHMEKAAKSPTPPYLILTEPKIQWISINPAEVGLCNAPCPIFYSPNSIFKRISDFFLVDLEDLEMMTESDLLRFQLAAINTQPAQRQQSEAMIRAADNYLYELRKGKIKTDYIYPPYGLPELYWNLRAEWIRAPTHIPFTIYVDDYGHLDPRDTLTHLWVTSVSWSRNCYIINLLLILFSRKAVALAHIWITTISPTRDWSEDYEHPCLPWQLYVPQHVAFHGRYHSLTLDDLTAFALFLIDVCKFPIFNRIAIRDVCYWADDFLAGKPRNSYSTIPKGLANRNPIINQAHDGQPWSTTILTNEPCDIVVPPKTPPRQ